MEHSCVTVFAHHSKVPRFDPQLFKSTKHQIKWLKLRNAKWFFPLLSVEADSALPCSWAALPSWVPVNCEVLSLVLSTQVCDNIKPGASVLACCLFHSPAGNGACWWAWHFFMPFRSWLITDWGLEPSPGDLPYRWCRVWWFWHRTLEPIMGHKLKSTSQGPSNGIPKFASCQEHVYHLDASD